MNANAQSEAVAGHLRQNITTMLHLASAEQSGVSRLENHLQAIAQALVNPAEIGRSDPLDSIQAPRHGVAGQGIVKICRDDADYQQLGMHLIFAARCTHGYSCEKKRINRFT
jgi:hypothetical protein